MPGAEMSQEFKSLSPVLNSSDDEHDDNAQIDEVKLVRKIDLRVLPMLFVIYVAAFLDRFVFYPFFSSCKALCCRTSEADVSVVYAVSTSPAPSPWACQRTWD